MTWTRRQMLQVGGTLAGGILAGTPGIVSAVARKASGPGAAAAAATAVTSKHILLRNLHTDEKVDLEFYRGDAYVPDALRAVQRVLRDLRNNEQHVTDPKLMDYLYDVAHTIGVQPVFSVISGYRTPQTNAHGSGLASPSLHMQGRAIDVRLAGVDCAALAQHSLAMERGGVGYYRQSDFVHLDTGRFRTWKG